ncbi:MAG: hydroxymethylbilane synthase [Dehalococcoidia bacterium]
MRDPLVRVGSRGSQLALRQTEQVVAALRRFHPGVEFRVYPVRTEGDRRARAPLSRIGGQGVFVRELEARLATGEVDLAVHSLKDVPTELALGLTLAAVPAREDPGDALVSRRGLRLAELPAGARVGTGSARRAVQARALRPDLEYVDIRGNVDTRLRRVREGSVDAVILAAAGLARLGRLGEAAEVLDVETMLPAAGQGALAVEARTDDAELCALVAPLEDRETRAAAEAERAFLRRLGAGCRLPVGALGEVGGPTLRLRALIADGQGERILREELTGRPEEAEALGTRLAERLLALGADEFMAESVR